MLRVAQSGESFRKFSAVLPLLINLKKESSLVKAIPSIASDRSIQDPRIISTNGPAIAKQRRHKLKFHKALAEITTYAADSGLVHTEFARS